MPRAKDHRAPPVPGHLQRAGDRGTAGGSLPNAGRPKFAIATGCRRDLGVRRSPTIDLPLPVREATQPLSLVIGAVHVVADRGAAVHARRALRSPNFMATPCRLPARRAASGEGADVPCCPGAGGLSVADRTSTCGLAVRTAAGGHPLATSLRGHEVAGRSLRTGRTAGPERVAAGFAGGPRHRVHAPPPGSPCLGAGCWHRPRRSACATIMSTPASTLVPNPYALSFATRRILTHAVAGSL